MPIGDALFHAHRFQDVLRGNLTSRRSRPAATRSRTRRGSTSWRVAVCRTRARAARRHGAAAHHHRRRSTRVAGLLLYLRSSARAWHDRLAGGDARSRSTISIPLELPDPDGRQPDQRVRGVAGGRGAGADAPRRPAADGQLAIAALTLVSPRRSCRTPARSRSSPSAASPIAALFSWKGGAGAAVAGGAIAVAIATGDRGRRSRSRSTTRISCETYRDGVRAHRRGDGDRRAGRRRPRIA